MPKSFHLMSKPVMLYFKVPRKKCKAGADQGFQTLSLPHHHTCAFFLTACLTQLFLHVCKYKIFIILS